MANYMTRIRTPKPPSEVFGYLADLRNFEEWDPGTVTSRQVAGEGPGAGAAYELVVKVPPGTMTMRYDIVEYDPIGLVVARGVGRFLSATDRISVEADRSGTGSVVTYDAEVELNRPLRLLAPLLSLGFQRTGNKARDGLCAALAAEVV